MPLSSLLLALLSTAPIRVAAPGFNAVDVDPKRVDFFVDYLADQLGSQERLVITTKTEIAALLGMERQRQLLGCSETSSECLAELAGALGADALLIGNVVKVGTEVAATIKIVRASNGVALASTSGRFPDDARLLDWLRGIAPELGDRVRAGFGGPAAAGASAAPRSALGQPRNRLVLGLLTLGAEHWLNDALALGVHAHALGGLRFLLWPQFAVGSYGGGYVRYAFLQPSPFRLSALGTVGIGVVQEYRNPTYNNVNSGLMFAPGLEVAWHGLGVALETPLFLQPLLRSGEGERFMAPLFLRLTYAFAL